MGSSVGKWSEVKGSEVMMLGDVRVLSTIYIYVAVGRVY